MAESKHRRMSSIKTELVIEDIRKYPCLYDKRHKDYKDIVLKQSIWKAIGIRHNITDCEKYWKIQRDRYNRGKKKFQNSLISGAALIDKYIPKWALFEVMDSMLSSSHNEAEETITNVSDEDSINALPIEIEVSEETDISPEQSTNLNLLDNTITSNTSSNARKRKQESVDNVALNKAFKSIAELSSPVKEFFNSEKALNKKEHLDRIKLFCMSMEEQLKNLSKADSFQIMKQMEMLMLEKEAYFK